MQPPVLPALPHSLHPALSHSPSGCGDEAQSCASPLPKLHGSSCTLPAATALLHRPPPTLRAAGNPPTHMSPRLARLAPARQGCEKCEKKLTQVACPEKWKDGANETRKVNHNTVSIQQ